jgi:predicted DNA-binding transcriptional regulator AlpA
MAEKKQLPRFSIAAHDKYALTIHDFCRLHSISEFLFYQLNKEGRAPKTMAVGSKRLISIEAAAEWRREREAHS